MGKRIIAVSSELWTELCTQGHEIGRHGVVTCTAGLPEDARFLGAEYEEQPNTWPILLFYFEHSDWEGPVHGGVIPRIEVTYSWDYRIEIAGHECGGPGVLDLWCREKDGEFFIEDPEYAPVRVNFCPFCGAKAPKQVEVGDER